MATKAKKQSTGRQKIEIKKITNKSSLEVTFTKRRSGLFNKASELCVLTGAEAAVVVFSPGKKAFVFGYPSVDAVIDRYIRENTNEGRSVNTSTASRCDRVVQESREQYVEALAKKEEAKKRVEMMMKEGGKVGFGLDRFWWDLSIEEMGLEELEQYLASMEELKKNVGIRVDELEKASNSPSKFFALDSGLNAIHRFGADEGY